MGLVEWWQRRAARNIVRSMVNIYAIGKAQHPEMLEAQLCRDFVGTRYSGIPPKPVEQLILSTGIEDIEDLYDACVLVMRAESNLAMVVENEVCPEWEYWIRAIVETIPDMLPDYYSASDTSNNIRRSWKYLGELETKLDELSTSE